MPEQAPQGDGAVEVAYQDDWVTLYHGDYAQALLGHVDPDYAAVITDPPYGDTSLDWDERNGDWIDLMRSNQLWCFGSMRYFLASHPAFEQAGWKYAQEVVWEKHNGSGLAADRFRRVHEFAVHFYRGRWGGLHIETQTTPDATARTVRRKSRPTHTGHIGNGSYTSHDGGPRLMRSVQRVRSEHGRAVHPTQKPLGILEPLIQYSVAPGCVVLDPFAGSGSTLLAARRCGRRAIGVEIDPDYCEAAVQRLSQTDLFAASASTEEPTDA